MLVMLTYIENNNGIQKELLDKLKGFCADKSATFLKIPTEDVFLMVDEMIKNIR